MIRYNVIRKFVETVSRFPAGPSLHGIITVGGSAAETAWRHLRDYAKTYPDITIAEPIQMVFWASGAAIKVFSIQDVKGHVYFPPPGPELFSTSSFSGEALLAVG